MEDILKLCSGAEAVRKLQKAGWNIARQKGSHVMLTKPGYPWTLSIPQHKELGPGILRKLIRQANLSLKEFNDL
jgi:predicted RNA binding protein YcfA (HicA-like mRNA interferase family)